MITRMTTIKQLRVKQFLSQEDLAKKSEMTVSTINRLEKGKQKPRLATIRKLAKALKVKPQKINFDKNDDG
jgi:transcriptional regulator with XRE-family HTH domain